MNTLDTENILERFLVLLKQHDIPLPFIAQDEISYDLQWYNQGNMIFCCLYKDTGESCSDSYESHTVYPSLTEPFDICDAELDKAVLLIKKHIVDL
jgi:hypothetical protein